MCESYLSFICVVLEVAILLERNDTCYNRAADYTGALQSNVCFVCDVGNLGAGYVCQCCKRMSGLATCTRLACDRTFDSKIVDFTCNSPEQSMIRVDLYHMVVSVEDTVELRNDRKSL